MYVYENLDLIEFFDVLERNFSFVCKIFKKLFDSMIFDVLKNKVFIDEEKKCFWLFWFVGEYVVRDRLDKFCEEVVG